MKLPTITTLQFAVLAALVNGSLSGLKLRIKLSRIGVIKTMPGFYQLMSRLERDGLVKGEYIKRQLSATQIVRERRYAITFAGFRAVKQFKNFVSNQ